MRAVLISACPVQPEMKRYLQPEDWVVACDAGYRNCQALQVQPNVVVGDFDSAPQPEWGQVIALSAEKDDTDTHYAARMALQKGCDAVLMLGALGGWRLDHTLANLATALYLEEQGAAVLLADEHTEVRILLAGQCLELNREDWAYFSLFSIKGKAEGITLHGAYYPLDDAALDADMPLGVSNAFAAETVQISLKKGSLVVVCTKKEP